MRRIQFAISCLAFLMAFQSCKPKDKDQVLQDLFRKDSTRIAGQEDKKNISARELIVNKWRMIEVFPEPPNEQEKSEMLNMVIEFTRDGKVMVTEKGVTKEEATFTLTMDDRYILSTETNRVKTDTIFIEEITPDKLVLRAIKDQTKIILGRER